MSNLPSEHHRLNTHARHIQKGLTALLWTARFRWTATLIVDSLLGGNGLVRKLIQQGLLVEHPISNPFAPVRYYTTLSKQGLDLLHRHWPAIRSGKHGDVAMALASGWELPLRPEHRIREARFEHDLQVQLALLRSFHVPSQPTSLLLADDLERTTLDRRPSKIPDIVLEFRPADAEPEAPTLTLWGEVEYSRKKQREIDLFCAYYRGALAGVSARPFDLLVVLCHDSMLAQWRRDFSRTVVPKWHFRRATRDWVRLDAKDWHQFPAISSEEVDRIIQPLTPKVESDLDAQA